jgi:hypothetical protein
MRRSWGPWLGRRIIRKADKGLEKARIEAALYGIGCACPCCF